MSNAKQVSITLSTPLTFAFKLAENCLIITKMKFIKTHRNLLIEMGSPYHQYNNRKALRFVTICENVSIHGGYKWLY